MDFYLSEIVGPYPVGVGAAKNTFTTKQDISPSPLPVILGGKLRRGSQLSIRSKGEYSSLTGAVLTLGYWFGTRAGAITGDIAIDGAFTTGTTPAAWPFEMEWDGLVTQEGASGTLVGQGVIRYGSSLLLWNADRSFPVTQALRTVTSFDTTIERAIGVSGTWGASNASNTITVNFHRVAILN